MNRSPSPPTPRSRDTHGTAPVPHKGPQGSLGGRRRGLRWGNWVVFGLLLVVPCYALHEFSSWIDWRILAFGPLSLSAFSFYFYRSDKQKAQAGEWRIPESTLHFTDLIGGWPGGFLAQREYRHKTAKGSFQFVFWMTVALHEFLAFDSLIAWRFTRELVRRLGDG